MSSNDDFCFHYDYAGRYVIGSDDNLTHGNGAKNKSIINAYLPRTNNDTQVYGTGYRSLSLLKFLKTVHIPKTYKYIGHDSFRDCPLLESVTFEKNSQVETIGFWLLRNTQIKTFTYPSSAKTIKIQYSFYGCTKLKSIFYRGMLRINNNDNSFTNVSDSMKIYVLKNYPYDDIGGRKVTKVLNPNEFSYQNNICTRYIIYLVLVFILCS